jgi:hypothetical protein
MSISFNNGPSESLGVTDKTSFSFHVPKEAWNRRAHATLAFTIEDPGNKVEFIRIDFRPVDATSSNGTVRP